MQYEDDFFVNVDLFLKDVVELLAQSVKASQKYKKEMEKLKIISKIGEQYEQE